jgi:RNA polymerase sigma-70 factor (ECF subfamily)
LLRCEHDAADAVQEAFLSAFRSMDQFTHRFGISAWLRRIVINACLMKLRSEKYRRSRAMRAGAHSFDKVAHHSAPSEWQAPQHVEVRELRATVRRCINELPGPYRSALVLRDIDDLDTQETADRLGISPAAVKVRLHRARQMLRARLDPMLS